MNGGWQFIILQRAYLKAKKNHKPTKALWKMLRSMRAQLLAKKRPESPQLAMEV